MVKFYRGIIIVKPHGSLIMNGKKKLIIKSIKLTSAINKPLLLIQNKEALGIIKLKKAKPINLVQFSKLKNKHKITDEERKKWWKGKRTLYSYDIIIVKKYKKIKKIQYPTGPQVFVKPENIKFLK